jgi:hypothetical protein
MTRAKKGQPLISAQFILVLGMVSWTAHMEKNKPESHPKAADGMKSYK